MGLFEIGAIAAGVFLAKKGYEKAKEEQNRKSTPFSFPSGHTEVDFEAVAKKCAKRINRIKSVEVSSQYVYVNVLSRSGINVWHFQLDFNDHGELTGSFWCTSENSDSDIPNVLGEMIGDEVQNW